MVPTSWLGKAARREMYVAAFRDFGLLYDATRDAFEAGEIRDECEALGVPMGYGRVGKTPTLLCELYGDRVKVD
jgi:hypothetical protein